MCTVQRCAPMECARHISVTDAWAKSMGSSCIINVNVATSSWCQPASAVCHQSAPSLNQHIIVFVQRDMRSTTQGSHPAFVATCPKI
jgi:hypothetical protein